MRNTATFALLLTLTIFNTTPGYAQRGQTAKNISNDYQTPTQKLNEQLVSNISKLKAIQFAPTEKLYARRSDGGAPFLVQTIQLELRVLELAKELELDFHQMILAGKYRSAIHPARYRAVRELRSLPKEVVKNRAELYAKWEYLNAKVEVPGTWQNTVLQNSIQEVLYQMRMSLFVYGSISVNGAPTRFNQIQK